MAIEAIIFDWGGTLTPWHPIDGDGMWRAYAEAYDPDHAEELAHRLAKAETDAWIRARDDQVSGTLDDLLTSNGVTPSGPAHEQAMARYQEFWEPHTFLDPDGLDLLTGLKKRGLRVGVLSNTLWTREYHEEVFRRDGVLDLIDAAVYSSEIPWTKPHPESFRAALHSVGDPDPQTTAFVGDRLYDDVWGAQQVGLRTIYVPHSDIPDNQRGHTDGVPDATVQRLAEIAEVLDSWND